MFLILVRMYRRFQYRAVTDNSGLSASVTYNVVINDENQSPEPSIAGSVIFKIPENSQGGTVVGNLVQNKHFFDEDSMELLNLVFMAVYHRIRRRGGNLQLQKTKY